MIVQKKNYIAPAYYLPKINSFANCGIEVIYSSCYNKIATLVEWIFQTALHVSTFCIPQIGVLKDTFHSHPKRNYLAKQNF